MTFRTLVSGLAAGLLALSAALPASAQGTQPDRVTFGTNWLAQPEHGGFYQAVADGTYALFGLDVRIVPGGPGVQNRTRFAAGQVDFYMGGQFAHFDVVRNNVPTIAVASIFQKDPQVIIVHPDRGFETFADLARLETLYLGAEGRITFFGWMKAAYPGFNDGQVRPYGGSPAPFMANPNSGQQGYITAEPYDIARVGGFVPQSFLLADYGFNPYSTTIEAHIRMVETRPDVVQRFVDASIIGWINYLWGDNAAANALIMRDNPDITPERIAYSVNAMKDEGIVMSGDAETLGIGCMTDERYRVFYDQMVAVGAVPAGIDIARGYTTAFVCNGVGLDLWRELSQGGPAAQ